MTWVLARLQVAQVRRLQQRRQPLDVVRISLQGALQVGQLALEQVVLERDGEGYAPSSELAQLANVGTLDKHSARNQLRDE